MLKKIQNYLLLHHPLLWNTRVVPVLAISLMIHILFFIVGYIDGKVDFSEYNGYRYSNTDEVAVFMSVTITILLTAIWLVFYLRNNAFKSFYPKNNASLFKEWLLLLLVCTFNCAFMGSFFTGSDVRKRSYYSEEELLRRVEVLRMASVLTDGPFMYGDTEVVYEGDEQIVVKRDSFEYNKRKYALSSLMNRTILSSGVNSSVVSDSIAEAKVKGWMMANKKDSVYWVLQEFDKIAREHAAYGNITPKQWLDMVYHYPEFTGYVKIGTKYEDYIDLKDYQNGHTYSTTYYNDYGHYEEAVEVATTVPAHVDTTTVSSDTIPLDMRSFRKIVTKDDTYIVHKYFVPHSQLVNAYADVAEGYYSPDMPLEAWLGCLYFGMAMSLLLFSFRVTSGRSWLIAAVAFGIVALLTAIGNIIFGYLFLNDLMRWNFMEERFFLFWILLVLALLLYFYRSKKSKSITAIILNIIIWLAPAILPTLGIILHQYYRVTIEHKDGVRITPVRFLEQFFENYMALYLAACFIAIIALMYLFTLKIKKWKGLPEA